VWIVQMVIEMVLLLLGSLLVMWFSRWREFRADAGGARLAGRQSMIGALRALQRDADVAQQVPQPAVQTLRISSPGGVARLFMSHPPLDERIARLEQMVASLELWRRCREVGGEAPASSSAARLHGASRPGTPSRRAFRRRCAPPDLATWQQFQRPPSSRAAMRASSVPLVCSLTPLRGAC
jgi:hypothetical protein